MLLRLVILSLVLLPITGFAQAGPPEHPYYIGVGIHGSEYQPIGWRSFPPTRVPVQLTAGYQLRPRLAVQAGIAYYGKADRTSHTYTFPDRPDLVSKASRQSALRTAAVSLLARYTISRQPHRLQADVLGGFTWQHVRYHDTETITQVFRGAEASTNTYETNVLADDLLLTAGPSVRYAIGQHLEAMLDATLNCALNSPHNPNTTTITAAGTLGLRYRFGTR
jgi:hypothetical protein